MSKRIPFLIILIICSCLWHAPADATDEFKEAARQTEDEWKAVQGSLKDGKKSLDDLRKKYDEYRAAAFSDAPEQGLELARKLFHLDKNDTQAAEAKVEQMRDMFRELDSAGITDKLGAASEYLDKANGYAGEVESIWEFTKKFDPDHAKDNPTYGLRLIGSVLTESAEKLEGIPLVGQILGPWVKAYGEVAGDFANSLDRLAKKIDDFRGGSLCGQLGRRQGQQEAFAATGATDCLTYFASGIFPRLEGETYEGNVKYFLYDPVSEKGYLASKEAEIVYRWHERLLEKRILDPDWLAARANTLKPEFKSQAREAYELFDGWANKTDPSWLLIDKLGLYQDAYFYGRLDELTFMANYILDAKHHRAANAILQEYEKYVLVRGTVDEEVDGMTRPSAGAKVEFTVNGALFSAYTDEVGRYEIVVTGQVNDSITEAVSKLDFETISRTGRLSGKVVGGLDYALTDGGLSVVALGLSGSIFASSDLDGNSRITTASTGQEIYLQTSLNAPDLERSDTVLVELDVLLPDGRTVSLQPPGIPVRPGQMMGYGTAVSFLVAEDLPSGTCHITGRLQLGEQIVLLTGTTIEIEKLDFEIGELLISLGPKTGLLGTKFAVGDPIHLQTNLTGVRTGSGAPITGQWQVTLPDGRTANPQETRLWAEEGFSGALSNEITTNESLPLGIYRVELIVKYADDEIARRSGSFELAPLFANPEFLITDSQESLLAREAFRPADPFFVLAKAIYTSLDPERQVHVVVELNGPDPGIGALGYEGDLSFEQGSMITGVGTEIPSVIQEGVYSATVTLDGGSGQYLTYRENFRIVYPVQFDGIWTRDGMQPSQVQSRFTGGDSYEWYMTYHFDDPLESDQYASALWCQYGEIQLSALSSDPLGPDTPYPGPASSSFTGVIPLDMPSAAYEVRGVVWYNNVAYYSPGTIFKVGQEPTITITSPQPAFEVDKKVLIVTGTCADEQLQQAQLFSNGEAIPIKLNNGKFSAKTVLRPGINEISVVAENEVGRSEDTVWGTANIQASVLKVVLTWEAPKTDVDLWVTDPQGKVATYRNQKPAEGRQLDVDDTSGPGMETYTIEVPVRGDYQVAVHYYAKHGWEGTVPFNLQFTSWETTYNESRSSGSGTLYEAAGNSDKPGAVEYFNISVY